jgi:hypothetical protein
MPDNTGWEKIVAVALVTSFFTTCLIDPVKVWIQRRLKRREVRRSLYSEIVNNFVALQRQVELAKHTEEMKIGIGQRFAMGYKRLAYDLAMKDAAAFYSLGFDELYWIELLYRDFEHVIHGRPDSEDKRLSWAEFAADYVLNNLKNRHMSKRLMFGVSPRSVKEHFRHNLPLTPYIDTQPPGVRERLFRLYDRLQYWAWRRLYAPRTP